MKNQKKILSFVLALALVLSLTSVAFAAEVYASRYGTITLTFSSTVKATVKNVQADLTKNTSKTLAHDGQFGPLTETAAMEFQRGHGLQVDGIVGKNTKTSLYPLRDTGFAY